MGINLDQLREFMAAQAKATPGPWYCEVDGWPVYDTPQGQMPYWASDVDESEGNPYRPYVVSFDTLAFVALARSLPVAEWIAERERLEKELTALRAKLEAAEKERNELFAAIGEAAPRCSFCDNPAMCYGKYSDHPAGFACDECCGHGCEDGHCELLPERTGR